MNISHVIYLILIAVIIALSITIAVKNNQIDVLHAEKQALNMQIVQAESSIKLQNAKIEEYKLDIEKADIEYKKGLKSLQEAYSAKDTDIKNKTCEEILNAIKQEQEIFLSGG